MTAYDTSNPHAMEPRDAENRVRRSESTEIPFAATSWLPDLLSVHSARLKMPPRLLWPGTEDWESNSISRSCCEIVYHPGQSCAGQPRVADSVRKIPGARQRNLFNISEQLTTRQLESARHRLELSDAVSTHDSRLFPDAVLRAIFIIESAIRVSHPGRIAIEIFALGDWPAPIRYTPRPDPGHSEIFAPATAVPHRERSPDELSGDESIAFHVHALARPQFVL